jgi:hypothetical protein
MLGLSKFMAHSQAFVVLRFQLIDKSEWAYTVSSEQSSLTYVSTD